MLLMAVFLEKYTAKSSTNFQQALFANFQGRARDQPPGHPRQGQAARSGALANTRTVETVQISPVRFCEHCGEDLRKVACREHERRTQIDIVFEKVLTHLDAEIKHCPQCQMHTRGPSFPDPVALACNAARSF